MMNEKVVDETSETRHRHGIFDRLDRNKLVQ